MLFDSHTHINNDDYTEEERAELIEKIEQSDVGLVVDVGFDIPSSIKAISHATKYSWCYAAIGIHPHDAKDMTNSDIDQLRKLSKDRCVVAIGEIGLDYHYNNPLKDEQRLCFRKQIRLALELGLPIIIHDRESDGEAVQILEEEGAFNEARIAKFPKNPVTGYPDARVLLHCYAGTKEDMFEHIKRGITISIAGPVTYKNSTELVKVAEAIPLAHMLIETDAPYLTPVPFRGKPNSSPLVKYTAEKIAEIRGVSYSEIEQATYENAKRFFNIV